MFAIILLALGSCTSIDASEGDPMNHVFNETDFNAVSLQDGGVLTFTESNTVSIIVNTTQAVIDVMDIAVDNSILTIKTKDGQRISNSDAIKITITAPNVNTFINSGTGDINITKTNTDSMPIFNLVVSGSGAISTNRAYANVQSMTVSGSGNITTNEIIAENCQATISGSGSINCNSGTATTSIITISGSGSYEGADMLSNNVTTKISGSGTAKVNAKGRLNVAISGSGDVTYKGSPKVEMSASGSGRLIDGN